MGSFRHTSSRPSCTSSPTRAVNGLPVHCPSYLDETLLDSRFDSDSCGVGFVAQLSAQPSHAHPQARTHGPGPPRASRRRCGRRQIQRRRRRDHRHSPCLAAAGNPPRPRLGRPARRRRDLSARRKTRSRGREIESALADQNLEVLKWRAVPVRPEVLGEIANSSRPAIWQVLITAEDERDFDRRLYLARKQFERSQSPGYVVSISSTTMIYKALCAGRLLADFYPDLADPDFKTPFALFHQRYATNVLPSWSRAQPFRTLAHNGEINTIWGNRARMEARAATLAPRSLSGLERRRLRLDFARRNRRAPGPQRPHRRRSGAHARSPRQPRQHFGVPAIQRRLHGAMGRPRGPGLHRRPPGRRHPRSQRPAPLSLCGGRRRAWLSPAPRPASSTWIPSASCTAAASAPAR